jgi:hypothetical protein
MLKLRHVLIGFFAAALASAPISAASAHGVHHHGRGLFGGLFGLAGAVVVGAVTIATAPIAILAGAASGPNDYRRGGYNRRIYGYYGYGPAPNEEGSNYYRGPRGYNGAAREYNYPPRDAYAAPPQNYGPPQDNYRREPDSYPPRDAYAAPPQNYGPPQDNYRGEPDSYPPRTEYNAPSPGYSPDQRTEGDAPPQGSRPPSNIDRGPPDDSPPSDDDQ